MLNASDYCRSRKKIKHSHSFIAIISVVLLVLVVAGCGDSKSVDEKSTKRSSETAFYKYGDLGLKKASEQELENILDKTVKKGKDSVTVKESYYDKSRISLSLVAGGTDMIAKEYEYEFYYAGKLLPISTRWVQFAKVIAGAQNDVISLDTLSYFPPKFDLKVVAKRLPSKEELLSITVPVDRTASDALTKETSIMKTFAFNSRKVLVKSVLMTPSSTIVKYENANYANDLPSSPLLFNQKNVKVKTIGKGGFYLLRNNSKSSFYEFFSVYAPLSLEPGNLTMSFVFVDAANSKIPITAQFAIQ